MGNIINDNRIVYVEPNDVYGQVDNHPLTPDYTDYCIYCNLIVEKTSRFRNAYVGDDFTGKFALSTDSYTIGKGLQYTSFFEGESRPYHNLTTDYTDIHFNTIKEQTFIEGLQITGIDINYAVRMCPMVTINMVDIRGAGLFGREESTHVNGSISGLERDEEGRIIDNIYGGFMTFPYPRYKLQIKGFYGRAVTYQLTCQNFNGSFDSNTGNFNITATFIGYEYGCLQDLPLSYVMAAPFTRSGKKYWNKKKNSPEWNLFIKEGKGSEPPMLMHDFFRNVKGAIDKYNKAGEKSLNELIADTSLDEIDKELFAKQNGINPILEQMGDFIRTLKKYNSEPSTLIYEIDDDEPEGDKVIVIFSKNSNINITKEVANAYNKLGDLIDVYGKLYQFDGVSLRMIPNNVNRKWGADERWSSVNVSMPKFLQIGDRKLNVVSTSGYMKQISMSDGEYDLNDPKVRIACLNSSNDYTFNSKQSVLIHSKIKNNMSDGSYPYASVIVCDGWNIIPNICENLQKKRREYEEKLNDGRLIPITRITGGVSPYIGNYYKMVICHVDTFMNTIWECADDIHNEIYVGKREPGKLGVYNRAITDVPSDIYSPGVNKGVIPPFPAIYKNYDGDDFTGGSVTEESTKTLGWVGDIRGSVPWREQALVEEYYLALKQIDSSIVDVPWTENDPKILSFNLLPCFLDSDENKKNKNLFSTREGIAYYISTMTALIVGSMNALNTDAPASGKKKANTGGVSVDEAKLIGAILAKNVYDGVVDKERLAVINPGENGFAKDIFDIATISTVNGNGEVKKFEFANGNTQDRRQRLFSVEDNNKLKYVYLLNRHRKPIIPLDTISDWNDLQKNYDFNNTDNGSVVIPKKVVDGDYVTTEKGTDFSISMSGVTQESFMNSNMFSIWLDSCNVGSIQIGYDGYKSNGEKIGPYTKDKFVSKILNKYWKMEDNFVRYQTKQPESMVKSLESIPDILNDPDAKLTKAQLEQIKKLNY